MTDQNSQTQTHTPLTSTSKPSLLTDHPSHTSLTSFNKIDTQRIGSQSRKELIDICTRGTDEMRNIPYRCPACSGCKQCQHGAKLGLASPLSIQEQQDIHSNITFINSKPGHYISKLPLLPDYHQYIFTNCDEVDEANKKLLQQLQKRPPEETTEISRSYNELIDNKFIIPLDELPKIQRSYMTTNTLSLIP